MKNEENQISIENAKKSVLGETHSKIYTHAVFAQCILPIRALPKEQTFYEVKHGNSSLMVQSGVLWNDKNEAVKMEIPSGPKARILLPYIIDQVARNESPEVDMGVNMYRFMQENDIKIGGKNAKELQRQVNNIAASSINLGVWGETETHKFGEQHTYRVASKVRFWQEKNIDQLTFWNPTLTISDELMATLSNHRILVDMKPLIALQSSPRSMDMYMWLSYRIQSVRRPIKISFKDLHSIFGKGTKALGAFKQDFIRSIEEALVYLPDVSIDCKSDKKHLILSNNKHKVYLPPTSNNALDYDQPIESGIFGELQSLGVTKDRIKRITQSSDVAKIKKAIDVTKSSIEQGKVKNPAGFFSKALEGEWDLPESAKKEEGPSTPVVDEEHEQSISDHDWKEVRKNFAKKHGAGTFNSWIKDVHLIKKGAEVHLLCRSAFVAEEITKKYEESLLTLWKRVNTNVKRIKISK